MANKLIQTQEQRQQQVQRLSQQQMLQVKLLEMPLTELEESVNAELDDNPALEKAEGEEHHEDETDGRDEREEDFAEQTEREEREEALDKALENIGRDDEMPDAYGAYHPQDNADYEEIVYGDTKSFYDKLKEQMMMENLTDTQKDVMEYLIGSLDDDGYLRKDVESISDELAIYHNIDVTPTQIEEVLYILQGFDPAGIGARSLQECLLLQVERRPESKLKDILQQVVTRQFDAFTKKHWDKIQANLKLSDLQLRTVQEEIRKLNPKPGASMGETMGRNVQQITPDFIIDVDDNNNISFTLNQGKIPQLTISPAFSDMVDTYKNNKENMNRQEKEALLYAKQKIDKAQGFIDAIKQRRHTLYITMKAIIDWQRKFFLDGDESDLKPMILKNIADKTGLDISTISRVSNIKYAQTKWGTFPLRFFFTDSYTTDEGEEFSTRKIKLALKEVIEHEDKHKPFSDEALAKELRKMGFPVARRTVAKYREQLGLSVARLRKE
ncbi:MULTISPECIES: RNA polymerase factor sigma-54 [Prevotellaceae]|uniref:RNA polymerase sigma54 factor n=1 Tax=Hoylesella buccalis DNF00853 TaxID=1401074 RepID=A0A096AVJ2_9BACT|nr:MULTISPECIES: RNA polymerase factor sigma-54 [Prevotellaceae]KGF34632.1 RNA polymerase sigma54 factor [Hoylesella buccalis DNF00853]KGF39399.1 RNA polymerase sigma54 factor [Hoylesella buccalis DNF00985]